jgi:hypothetical protein
MAAGDGRPAFRAYQSEFPKAVYSFLCEVLSPLSTPGWFEA